MNLSLTHTIHTLSVEKLLGKLLYHHCFLSIRMQLQSKTKREKNICINDEEFFFFSSSSSLSSCSKEKHNRCCFRFIRWTSIQFYYHLMLVSTKCVCKTHEMKEKENNSNREDNMNGSCDKYWDRQWLGVRKLIICHILHILERNLAHGCMKLKCLRKHAMRLDTNSPSTIRSFYPMNISTFYYNTLTLSLSKSVHKRNFDMCL